MLWIAICNAREIYQIWVAMLATIGTIGFKKNQENIETYRTKNVLGRFMELYQHILGT